jgi:hypothetical protein
MIQAQHFPLFGQDFLGQAHSFTFGQFISHTPQSIQDSFLFIGYQLFDLSTAYSLILWQMQFFLLLVKWFKNALKVLTTSLFRE